MKGAGPERGLAEGRSDLAGATGDGPTLINGELRHADDTGPERGLADGRSDLASETGDVRGPVNGPSCRADGTDGRGAAWAPVGFDRARAPSGPPETVRR